MISLYHRSIVSSGYPTPSLLPVEILHATPPTDARIKPNPQSHKSATPHRPPHPLTSVPIAIIMTHTPCRRLLILNSNPELIRINHHQGNDPKHHHRREDQSEAVDNKFSTAQGRASSPVVWNEWVGGGPGAGAEEIRAEDRVVHLAELGPEGYGEDDGELVEISL